MITTTTTQNRHSRPASPGIEGDYFECDEVTLVNKLNMLRGEAVRIPALLQRTDSESTDIDPEFFFDQDENDVAERPVSRNSFHRLDSELVSIGDVSAAADNSEVTNEKSSTKVEFSRSGSEVAWKADSFLLDDASPRSSSKFPPFSTDDAEKNDTLDRKLRRRLRTTPFEEASKNSTTTPVTASMSLSVSNNSSHRSSGYELNREQLQILRSKFRLPGEVTISMKNTIFEHEGETLSSFIVNQNCPRKDHRTTYKGKSSTSSSIDCEIDSDEESMRKTVISRSTATTQIQGNNSKDFISQQRHQFQTAPSRSSFPELEEQELYIRLAEEDDLLSFKSINNFSVEGDYLLSRILRESTRVRLKKDMLQDGEVDILCQLNKQEKMRPLSEDRGMYFSI